MVILGGMGNTLGVILAAILLTLLPEVLRPIAEYRMVLYSFLLIVLMLARPQGLFNFKFGKAKVLMIMPAPLLQLDQATIRFGGLTAVNAVDFTVGENELVGLIGPNGAGKTTVFNLITGVYQPTDGSVTFPRPPPRRPQAVNAIVACGIARTFQNIRLFGSLSVFDNVRVACNLHRATSPVQAAGPPRRLPAPTRPPSPSGSRGAARYFQPPPLPRRPGEEPPLRRTAPA